MILYRYKGWIPSMKCSSTLIGYCDSDRYKKRIRIAYAGGLYSGIIFLIPGIYSLLSPSLWDFPFEFGLISVGLVNIVYGIYEGMFLHKLETSKYMTCHYLLYIVTLTIITSLYYNKIIH